MRNAANSVERGRLMLPLLEQRHENLGLALTAGLATQTVSSIDGGSQQECFQWLLKLRPWQRLDRQNKRITLSVCLV